RMDGRPPGFVGGAYSVSLCPRGTTPARHRSDVPRGSTGARSTVPRRSGGQGGIAGFRCSPARILTRRGVSSSKSECVVKAVTAPEFTTGISSTASLLSACVFESVVFFFSRAMSFFLEPKDFGGLRVAHSRRPLAHCCAYSAPWIRGRRKFKRLN